MRAFLKKTFDFIIKIGWIFLTAIIVLFVWIPFTGFVCGSLGLVAGYLLSRGLSACFNSPLYLAIVLVVVGIFHVFPLSFAAVRLKNIFVRNWKLWREETPETNFSFIRMIREIIPVIFGALRSPLVFFLVLAALFGLLPTEKDKLSPKIWDNLDFVTVSVAAIFVVFGVFYSFFSWKDSPFIETGNRIERKLSELWAKFKSVFSFYPPESAPELERQEHFDAAPGLALVGLLMGLVGGLAVSISLAFIVIYPFWVIATAAFFSLFHLSDLRRMFREKMWFGFFGRIIVLLAISSYLAGFVCFGIIGFSNWFVVFTLLGVPLGMLCGWIWIWLDRYFPDNRYFQSFDQIVRGSYKLGIFWKEN